MRRQLARVEDYIAKGKDEADLVAGGGRPAHLNRGFYIEPTLFANVPNDARVAREEIFGPVICVIPAKDEEAAINLANRRVMLDNSLTFGGFHFNDPRQLSAELRYRFKF